MRSKHGWKQWIGTATVITALAAPAAYASPIDGRGTSPGLKAYQASREAGSSDVRSSDGFDWGDAGIGAAATFALAAFASGAALALGGKPRLRRRATDSTATTVRWAQARPVPSAQSPRAPRGR
jgi:hypothetical protein